MHSSTCSYMQTRSRGAVMLQLSWSQGRSHSEWMCTGSAHKGVNQCLKYVIQVQQRPESPAVTLTWHAYMGPTWAVSHSCAWLQLLRVKIHHKVPQYMPVGMSWEVSLVFHPLSSSHPWQCCTGLCVLIFAFQFSRPLVRLGICSGCTSLDVVWL